MGGQSLARNGTVATLDQQWLEADTGAQGLSRRRPAPAGRPSSRSSTRSAFRRPSCSPTTTSAWPARSRSTRTAGRCPSAAAARTVRSLTMVLADGTVVHLLAHRERRSVPSRHGRLRAVRRDHRAGARHGAERPAHPALRRDERPRDRRAIRAAARVRPRHSDGLRPDGRRARSFLRAGAADHLSARRRPEQHSRGVRIRLRQPRRRATSSARRWSPIGPSVFAGGPRRGSGRGSPATRRATA